MLTPLESAREALAAAEAAHAKVKTDAEAAGLAFDADIKALGPQPPAPTMPAKPTPPESPRPDADAVAAARALVQGASVARHEWKRYGADLAAAETAHRTAQADLATATATATLTTAALAAARAAPGLIAAEQAEAFASGDTAVEFPAKVDGVRHVPVIVRYCGRTTVSRGLGVRRAAELRAALRRNAAASKGAVWGMLPIVIDDVNALDGGTTPIDIPAPTVRLLTTAAGTGLGNV